MSTRPRRLHTRSSVALALWICTTLAIAAPAAFAGNVIANTPAGSALRSWLAAFNSGKSARIDSYDRAHAPWLKLPGMMRLRASTGGYDWVHIDKGGQFWIVFHIRERKTAAQVIGSVVVRSWQPDHITLLSLVPAGAHSDEPPLSNGERTRVIDGAARLLDEYYLFPQVARRVSVRLQALQKHGQYRGITDGEIFAVRLGDDLKKLSGDKHIGLDFFSKGMTGPDPHRDPRWLAKAHCGFESAEHLPPNIGYLKLTFFAQPEYCTRTAIATMSSLADSDALIIDLRDSHGGAPGMVALIASYLFAKPTHLEDIEYPRKHSADHLWTLPDLPGKKFTGRPVFVLTSRSTFSASEEFAYDLQSLARATVVGETTGGGAHVVAPHRIDGHFYIRIPFGRFVNPITRTDWEGTGVAPNVRVSAADALAVAERLAARSVIDSAR